MRRSTAQFLSIAAAVAFAGCGFTPSGQMATGGVPSGAGNSTGIIITGAGASSGSGNSGGGNSTGNSGIDSNCGARDKPVARLPPDILLVYDASGSMNEDLMNMSCTGGCGANSKWSIMAPAVNQAVMATEMDVNWGLKFFASNNDCTVNNTANVTVGAMRASMIASAIAGRTDAAGNVTNGSRTPTRAAVSGGATYLMGVQDDNPKFIVLVTDGLPNCPMSGGSSGDDTAGAVAAITASATAGIPVFVVGVATAGITGMNGVNADQVLTMFANAGGRARAGTPAYYSAANATELADALRTLVGTVSSCVFQIGPAPTTDGTTSTSYIDVFGDGTKIPRDTTRTNGWDYVDGSNQNSIQIYGGTCDAVTAGTIMNVVVTFRCVQG